MKIADDKTISLRARLKKLDKDILEAHNEGWVLEVNRLLDTRLELMKPEKV